MGGEDIKSLILLAERFNIPNVIGVVLAVFLILLFLKRQIFKGSGTFIKNSFDAWIGLDRERVAAQVKLAHALTDNQKALAEIKSGMGSHHDTYDVELKKMAVTLTGISYELDEVKRQLQTVIAFHEGGIA